MKTYFRGLHIGAKSMIFIIFQYKTNVNPIGNQWKSLILHQYVDLENIFIFLRDYFEFFDIYFFKVL